MRTVDVRPPDRRRETAGVLQAATGVCVAALLVAGARGGEAPGAAVLQPWQEAFAAQPGAVQRVVRELAAALHEMRLAREDEGKWPEPARLAADFVEPFAAAGGVTWDRVREGDTVNYLGLPAPGSGDPAFLLHLRENVLHPPGTPRNAADVEMRDGRVLHATVWLHRDAGPLPGVVHEPERSGWTQIVTDP